MTALRLFVGRLSHSLLTRNIPTTSPLPTSPPITALCREGRVNEALHALHNQNHIVDDSAYVYLLQCRIQNEDLHQGKRIHALILNRHQLRFREHLFLRNTLLQMYVKCGSLVDARDVFDGMLERDVFSRNVMAANIKHKGFYWPSSTKSNEVEVESNLMNSPLPVSFPLVSAQPLWKRVLASIEK